jgi:hypothetical protein
MSLYLWNYLPILSGFWQRSLRFGPVVLVVAVFLMPPFASSVTATEGFSLKGVRFIGGTADWKEIWAWVRHNEIVIAMEKQYATCDPQTKELSVARDRLAELAKPLGKAWPQAWMVLHDRAYHNASGNIFLARFDNSRFIAELSPEGKRALIVDLSFARHITARTHSDGDLKLVPAGTEPRKIFGFICSEHRIEGQGRGKVWITQVPKSAIKTLKSFFTAADRDVGGYPGSILYHAVMQTDGLPIIAKFSDVKGMTLSGNNLGASTVLAFQGIALSPTLPKMFEVPAGWSVKQLPPR